MLIVVSIGFELRSYDAGPTKNVMATCCNAYYVAVDLTRPTSSCGLFVRYKEVSYFEIQHIVSILSAMLQNTGKYIAHPQIGSKENIIHPAIWGVRHANENSEGCYDCKFCIFSIRQRRFA